MQRDFIKVATVDDHLSYRQGLEALFKYYPHIINTISAGDGRELIELACHGREPDVVLLDLEMKPWNGWKTAEYLWKTFPKIRTIIVTHHDSESFVSELVQMGARGFLLKNAGIDEFIQAIDCVITTGYYFNDKVTPELVRKLVKSHKLKLDNSDSILTYGEMELLRFEFQGFHRKDSFEWMMVEVKTYDRYWEHIYEKTKARSQAEAIQFCLENKIITKDFLDTPFSKRTKKFDV